MRLLSSIGFGRRGLLLLLLLLLLLTFQAFTVFPSSQSSAFRSSFFHKNAQSVAYGAALVLLVCAAAIWVHRWRKDAEDPHRKRIRKKAEAIFKVIEYERSGWALLATLILVFIVFALRDMSQPLSSMMLATWFQMILMSISLVANARLARPLKRYVDLLLAPQGSEKPSDWELCEQEAKRLYILLSVGRVAGTVLIALLIFAAIHWRLFVTPPLLLVFFVPLLMAAILRGMSNTVSKFKDYIEILEGERAEDAGGTGNSLPVSEGWEE